ncbi:MAG TPA: hypothetical protein VGX48_17760 [Pyrinomonadaceae bacterium]|jgi:hypothetical protein|nr:hypothetical protein [Pyrinomonadaceae bacterium]
MDEGRTPEVIATELRDAAAALNHLMMEAAQHGCKVEVEVKHVGVPDHISAEATHVRLTVYQLVAPTPQPVEAPTPARGKRGGV